jgi:hypothetical protein
MPFTNHWDNGKLGSQNSGCQNRNNITYSISIATDAEGETTSTGSIDPGGNVRFNLFFGMIQ